MAGNRTKRISGEQWEEWVRKAGNGDQEAFSHLYEETEEMVEKVCLRKLNGNAHDAEDAKQETYTKIYRSLSGELAPIKDPRKFRSWARSIAENTSKQYLRDDIPDSDKEFLVQPLSDEENIGLDKVSFYGGKYVESPEDYAAEEDWIRKAVDTLPQEQQEAIWCWQQGYTKQQAADYMGCTPGTAGSRQNSARKKLKKEILKIEKRENIVLHGFVLVKTPAGFDIKLTEEPMGQTSWIGAEEASTGTEIPKETGKTGAALSGGRLATIIVAVVAVIAIAVSAIMVNRNKDISVETTTSITVSSQTVQATSQAAQNRNTTRPSETQPVGTQTIAESRATTAVTTQSTTTSRTYELMSNAF